SRRNTFCPAGARRSSAKLFLLRPSSTKPGLLGSPGPTGGVARPREGAPPPRGPLFITSAPQTHITPAPPPPPLKLPQSITFSPSKTRSVITDPFVKLRGGTSRRRARHGRRCVLQSECR